MRICLAPTHVTDQGLPIQHVRTGYLGVSDQKFTTRLGSHNLADWTAQIEEDVNMWYKLYPNIGGIFFDEGWPECGGSNQYVNLYKHINDFTKRANPGALTVLNPGSPMASCYEDTMDTLLTFELNYTSYINSYTGNDCVTNVGLTASDCQEGNRRDCNMSGNQTSSKEGGV